MAGHSWAIRGEKLVTEKGAHEMPHYPNMYYKELRQMTLTYIQRRKHCCISQVVSVFVYARKEVQIRTVTAVDLRLSAPK